MTDLSIHEKKLNSAMYDSNNTDSHGEKKGAGRMYMQSDIVRSINSLKS